MNNECPQWLQVQRATDREVDRADRVRAAGHVRACEPCAVALREVLRLRRAFRALPPVAITAEFADRCHSLLWRQRNMSIERWLRRATAVAAAVMLAGLVAPTLLSAQSNDAVEPVAIDPAIVTPAEEAQVDSAQTVANWIVRDLSRGN